jgi:hypothetical protein
MKKKEKKTRKPQFGFECNEALISELQEVSKKTQIPASQIAREGTWEKLAELRKTHPALAREPEAVTV